MKVGKTGLLTRDAFPIACAFPPMLAVACNRLLHVAYSCGAVADFHRASRSSHHQFPVIIPFRTKTRFLSEPQYPR